MKSYLAYPEKEFRNYLITEELTRWSKSANKKEASETMLQHYKTSITSANFFIRIALAVFTFILACCSIGLLVLMTGGSIADSEAGIGIFALICGGAMLFVLENFIRKKKRYRYGTDDILLYMVYSAALTFFGFCFNFDGAGFVIIILIYAALLATAAAIRYNDMLMGAIAYCSFVGAILVAVFESGATSLVPFVSALIGGISYYFIRKFRSNPAFLLWDFCLWAVEILSLLLLYLALNYFVVRTLTQELMNIYLEEGQDIPLAFLFYTFTAIIPFVYLFVGLRSRNRVLFRTGLVLIAISALTFKYYFSTGHPEISLTTAGAVLLLICTALHFWLKQDKQGVTLKEDESDEPFQYIDAESLILVQGLSHHGNIPQGGNGVDLGGGKFGGGGSSDSY